MTVAPEMVGVPRTGAVVSTGWTLLVIARLLSEASGLPARSRSGLVPGSVYARVRGASPFANAGVTTRFSTPPTQARLLIVWPETVKAPAAGVDDVSIVSEKARATTLGAELATDAEVSVGGVVSLPPVCVTGWLHE